VTWITGNQNQTQGILGFAGYTKRQRDCSRKENEMKELPTIENAGIIAVSLAEKLTAQEQAFFVAGFQEAIKYLQSEESYVIQFKDTTPLPMKDGFVDTGHKPERCEYCGAGDDIHHSFSCPTNLHPDKRDEFHREQ